MKRIVRILRHSLKLLKGKYVCLHLSYHFYFGFLFVFNFRQTKKPIVSLSKIKQTELNKLLDRFDIHVVPVNVQYLGLDLTGIDRSANSFTWDGRPENQQADDVKDNNDIVTKEGYISYLKRNINVPNESDFYDVKSRKTLLSIKYDVLPFEISGTTDVVIATKCSAAGHLLSRGIQVGFKLKKNIQDSDVPQAIGQVFTANIRSNEAVLIVLTDLDNEWSFFWLENRDNNINVMQVRVGLHDAIYIISQALEQNLDSPLNARINFHNFREHARIGEGFGDESG